MTERRAHPLSRPAVWRTPLVAGFVLFALLVALGRGASLTADVVYEGVLWACAVACAARAVISPPDRVVAGLIGAGIASYAAGDTYYMLAGEASLPYPSLADVGWLSFYPLVVIAVVVRGWSARRDVALRHLLDAVVAATAAAGVLLAMTGHDLDGILHGDLALITTAAYPAFDVLLFAGTVGWLAALSGRADRAFGLLAAGSLAFAVTDTIYLLQIQAGTYVDGRILDLGWPAAGLVFCWAAWTPRTRRAPGVAASDGHRIALPLAMALICVALLVVDHFDRLTAVSVTLAGCALVAVLVRLQVTFADGKRYLRRAERQARTDVLTGLPNRLALFGALASAGEEPTCLAIFDLDGFKHYNDSFGHPAGDALLARLARNLEATLAPGAQAFRMGGDEFCLLFDAGDAGPEPVVAAAQAALTERGEGFSVTASGGWALLPDEATDASAALRLADQRMYERKRSGRASALSQTRELALSMLAARDSDLGDHVVDVAALAERLAERLGLSRDDVARTRLTAELHDIGKVAIPDAILSKPGPLSEEEWTFMHAHTVIGERICETVPALASVASLVRATHERHDGAGYPDGLRGAEVPLPAAIVFCCDAYDAMTTDRSYRGAMTPEAALEELRSCAGTQFHPAVVDAFLAEHAEGAFDAPEEAAA